MSNQQQSSTGSDAPTCSALVVVREVLRLQFDDRPNYYKVYVAGEALHEDHDSESDAEEQASRLSAKLFGQNK